MPIRWPEGKRPCFVGVGQTLCLRYSGRTLSSLANEAAMNAIADAGLTPRDIDGLAAWPNPAHPVARNYLGYDRLDVPHMAQVIPMENLRRFCQTEIPAAGVVGLVQAAATALASGACNYALIFRSGHHPPGGRYHQIRAKTAGGAQQFTLPYGHGVGGTVQAVGYQRYLHKYGATREEMAAYVLNANRNAQRNDYAARKGRTITFEEYMNARPIAYPMCIFDNDMPVDGVACAVMTTEDRAGDTPHPDGHISGMAVSPYNMAGSGIIPSLESQYEMELRHARNLYESAGVGHGDVDLIHVYDGFSPMVWNWLEAFGFCGVGEAHGWVQGGTIAIDGPHPVNTAGGSLGEGRLHGMSHIVETARFTDHEGYKSVAYANIVGVLVEAIRELEARVAALEAR